MAMAQTDNDKRVRRTNKGGRAFIVESLVMFVFLVAMLAVVTQLFIASAHRSVQGQNLERSVLLASNVAERFSADPLSNNLFLEQDGLIVTCVVTPQTMTSGTLYNAVITVTDGYDDIYVLETARYVSVVI